MTGTEARRSFLGGAPASSARAARELAAVENSREAAIVTSTARCHM
jgi:hypothetical protein